MDFFPMKLLPQGTLDAMKESWESDMVYDECNNFIHIT